MISALSAFTRGTVVLPRLFLHVINNAREFSEPPGHSGMFDPERLHYRAHDHLARWSRRCIWKTGKRRGRGNRVQK